MGDQWLANAGDWIEKKKGDVDLVLSAPLIRGLIDTLVATVFDDYLGYDTSKFENPVHQHVCAYEKWTKPSVQNMIFDILSGRHTY